MSCVIVSVCSALLVAMNHVTLYIVYIVYTISPSASACYVHARACRGICVCMCACMRACTCTRAFVRAKSLRLLYCVYFSVCVCVCVAHNYVMSMCLRVHIAIIRARRGAIDSEMERSSSNEPLSLPSLVVQHCCAVFFSIFSIPFSLSLSFFRSIGLRASA